MSEMQFGDVEHVGVSGDALDSHSGSFCLEYRLVQNGPQVICFRGFPHYLNVYILTMSQTCELPHPFHILSNP